jgi:hypothetical protein
MSAAIIVRCDSCAAVCLSQTRATVAEARADAEARQWSTAIPGEHPTDLCPVCALGLPRPAPPSVCGNACPGGELFDLLGHDALGHRTANSLLRAGVETEEQLRFLTARQLRGLPGVGAVGRDLIRKRLHAAPGARPG